MARDLATEADGDMVVGVTKLAWRYGRSEEWAKALLERWEREQLSGGPVRVFRHGKRNSLYTTLTVLIREMPPARDLVLYRRVEALEATATEEARRLDREIHERKAEVADLRRQIATIRRTG